jgi:hypothetical protein
MATIFELKEHLKDGGKIKRYAWKEGKWIKLIGDTFVDDDGLEFPSFPSYAFDSDWEVYEEPFKITHTGLYRSRDGRKAYISFVNNDNGEFCGIVEGEMRSRFWYESGKLWKNEEDPEDIVAEWEED